MIVRKKKYNVQNSVRTVSSGKIVSFREADVIVQKQNLPSNVVKDVKENELKLVSGVAIIELNPATSMGVFIRIERKDREKLACSISVKEGLSSLTADLSLGEFHLPEDSSTFDVFVPLVSEPAKVKKFSSEIIGGMQTLKIDSSNPDEDIVIMNNTVTKFIHISSVNIIAYLTFVPKSIETIEWVNQMFNKRSLLTGNDLTTLNTITNGR